MRSVRLGRTFDAVFVHDAIAYITTEVDLRAVFATAFEHTRPGGVALFVPDSVTETFEPAADHGGHDGPDRALRYLEWTWDPDPDDTTVRMDLLRVPRTGWLCTIRRSGPRRARRARLRAVPARDVALVDRGCRVRGAASAAHARRAAGRRRGLSGGSSPRNMSRPLAPGLPMNSTRSAWPSSSAPGGVSSGELGPAAVQSLLLEVPVGARRAQ